MPSTGIYTVTSPTSGTQYNAPAAYWVVPTNGTSISCEVKSYNASSVLTTVANLTVYIRNVSSAVNLASFNGGTANTTDIGPDSDATINGTNVFTVGASVGGTIDHIAMQVTNYTGSAYSGGGGGTGNDKVRRSGAWGAAVTIKVRRSGAWTSVSGYVRRSNAWSQVA